MNADDLEARLDRWQPADPPPDLLRRLRAAEPKVRAARWSWPLAYAGLAAVWVVILALWLATPHGAKSAATGFVAQTDAGPSDTPPFTNALAMERAYFFSRHNPDQL